MNKIDKTAKAESFCVDGDIRRTGGNLEEATAAYLEAHKLDPASTVRHLNEFTPDEIKELTNVLDDWLKLGQQSRENRNKLGVNATPDQIWNFIFSLKPEAITTCFARIEPLLKENRFQQVIDSCTAILRHYPQETAPILLQRGLAFVLIHDHDKEAIADYLRAFMKDKDITLQVVRSKQGQYLPHITRIIRDCIYAPPPGGGQESKQYRQWLHVGVDCCKLLLTLDPDNFSLQITYAERLKSSGKTDKAVAVLNETLGVLKLDLSPDPHKLCEALLRRGSCYILKQDYESAIMDISSGLNAVNDAKIKERRANNNNNNAPDKPSVDMDIDVDLNRVTDGELTFTENLVKEIYNKPNMVDVYGLLDKAASKLNPPDKFAGVMKVDNIRGAADLYRAMLILNPDSRDALIKLAACYTKLARYAYAIRIYDTLLHDPKYVKDPTILAARATCYRELGNKVEARKDYDALLRGNPNDATLLCDRALVHLENNDVDALTTDLQVACKNNQKTVMSYMNKLPLAQRTRVRQILFDHAKTMLQEAKLPHSERTKVSAEVDGKSAGSKALTISQLLTRLNPADQAAHILKAHSLFFVGSFNDAEASLKKLIQDHPENPDLYMIKLHLGVLRIFTNRVEGGMDTLVEVLAIRGERAVTNLLRDIPISERARLSDESHKFAISILQKRRDAPTVNKAAHCFTVAIVCCRGTDLILEDETVAWKLLTEAQCLVGIKKKSDKTSASAWSLATLDEIDLNRLPTPKHTIFSTTVRNYSFRFSPSEIFPMTKKTISRLNGGTGVHRSYLARAECMAHLGDQRAAILDFSAALEINPASVEALCGRAFMRLALGEENDCVDDVIAACENDIFTVTAHINALPEEARKLIMFWLDHRVVTLLLNYGHKAGTERLHTGASASTISVLDETVFKAGQESKLSSLSSIHLPTPVAHAVLESNGHVNGSRNSVGSNDIYGSKEEVNSQQSGDENSSRKLHKSSAGTNNLKDALLAIDQLYVSDKDKALVKEATDKVEPSRETSRGSTSTTSKSTPFTYDDIITGMEKTEILHHAQILGKLLITVDDSNATWHGMYADILIVKGEFDDALRHLHYVMTLTPSDVTAMARAGLINVKQNRYKAATMLLSALAEVDRSGLQYVLKALDSSRRRRLADESFLQAEQLSKEEKYQKAVEYYGLSIYADPSQRHEKLRMRSRNLARINSHKLAIEDITKVIQESGRSALAGDYCIRGHLHMLDNKEQKSCVDYVKAIKINKTEAITLIHVKPGRQMLSRAFYRQALELYSQHNYPDCAEVCDYGVMIDDNNIDLRKLRARAKREISKCSVQ